MNQMPKEAKKMELQGMRRMVLQRQRKKLSKEVKEAQEMEIRSKQKKTQSLQSLRRITSMSELEEDKLLIAIVLLKEYGFNALL